MLATADAHDLYRSYGFTDVADPECYLERAVPATELDRASPGIDLASGPALHHLRPVSVVLIRVEVRPAVQLLFSRIRLTLKQIRCG